MRFKPIRLGIIAAIAGIIGCGANDAPKTPLGDATAGGMEAGDAVFSPISGEAKMALDSANALFRAKAYPGALAQYRRSAGLAPEELAPLLGIMMVADITGDTRLADSTRPRIRKLNPVVADSSAAMSHSKIIEGHPRTGPANTQQ